MRSLFFTAVLALNIEKVEGLVKIASAIAEIPPLPSENPEAFVAFINKNKAAVEDWCKNAGLSDPWCAGFAAIFACSSLWYSGTSSSSVLVSLTGFLEQVSKGQRFLPEEPMIINFSDWNVTQEGRRTFIEKAKHLLDQKVNDYCNQKEAQAQAAGLVKARERRGLEPFYWLAGYQVNRWSKTRIAEAEGLERSTVKEQVNKLTADIGLSVRDPDNSDRSQTAGLIKQKLSMVRAEVAAEGPFTTEGVPPALGTLLPPAIIAMLT